MAVMLQLVKGSYQTARNDLLDLHELGLLKKARHGNAYVFFAPEDLRDRLATLATFTALP
jgi:DeoR/GlpR family transcriptional regulator of sugar metabolism